ncbi:hypothetical protein CRYUN_Cryun05aG0112200 [Craigia yunnanensis]
MAVGFCGRWLVTLHVEEVGRRKAMRGERAERQFGRKTLSWKWLNSGQERLMAVKGFVEEEVGSPMEEEWQSTATKVKGKEVDAEQAIEAARAAVNGGIAVLEIVRSTPGVFEVLQTLVKEYPTRAFGVGTVLNAKDAKTAINTGAKFLMSPATVKDIIDEVLDDVLYIPGVMTPTEIFSAYNAGAKIVKVSLLVDVY